MNSTIPTTTAPAAATGHYARIWGIQTHGALHVKKMEDMIHHDLGSFSSRAGMWAVRRQAKKLGLHRFKMESNVEEALNGYHSDGKFVWDALQRFSNWPVMIFASYSGLVSLIGNELITSDELSSGLFMFGCARIHAFTLEQQRGEPQNEAWWLKRNHGFSDNEVKQAHQRITAAVMCAENEGRAFWAKSDTAPHNRGDLAARVNAFLVSNGLDSLPLGQEEELWEGNLPDLEARVAKTSWGKKTIVAWSSSNTFAQARTKLLNEDWCGTIEGTAETKSLEGSERESLEDSYGREKGHGDEVAPN